MSAFINEFHYDNIGGDLGEFIEIAAPGGFDLTGWSIVLYNGSNGSSYRTIDLSGFSVVDSAGGFGFVAVDVAGLQNGSPDGMALVDNTGGVVEFLSYEGQLTATDGPANGMTSTDVVVAEGSTTLVGQSLQRQGVWDGSAADFTFAGPLDETPGALNEGQVFGDVTPDIPSLVITEFLADPDASDALGDANGDGLRSATQDEFVEIVNTGSNEVDLSGITISDGIDVRHIFADGTTLAAGAAIVVFGGGTPTGEFGGSQVVTASTGTLGLNNGGDTITIATADADIITSLDYSSEGGQNVSLTRDPDLTGDFVGHDDATDSGGAVFSPGTRNDGSAFDQPDLTPVLAINEIHADPAADITGDANGDGERDATEDEFVEIVNTGTVEADLSGVTISDGVGARHTFADGTSLAVGAAIVVFGGGAPTGNFGGAQVVTASSGGLGLNNGGDTVTLATASGDLITQVTYSGEGGNNQSLTRAPDLTGGFVQHTDVAGADGALFSPGTSANGAAFGVAPSFVINEVDADTQGTDTAEFIEIFDGGFGNQSLDGVFLALFNGGTDGDAAYDTIDLTGHTTDENGYFVIGSADVPNVDLEAFTSNGLQNGADAVALYTGVPTDLVDGLPTTTNLLDAIVYDTNDPDDSALLDALGLTEQYNEDENGQKDTQSNSRVPDGTGDFVAQAPTPGEANDADVAPPEPELRLISEIQGSSGAVTKVGLDDRSAFEGETVTVDAIVTANFLTGGLSGFFLQEEDFEADADANSSEGIFIAVSGTLLDGLDVSLGDQVSVTGTVQENFGQTQIAAINVSVISTNNAIPTASTVFLGDLSAIQDDDTEIDYVANLEAYEGMLVTFANSLTITELFNLDRFGEYRVSADGRPTQFTQANDPDAAGFDAHLQDVAANSILLDDGLTEQNPFEIQILDDDSGVLDSNDAFRMGDTLDNVTGVVAYSFDEFRIHDATGDYTETNERPDTPEDVGGSFKVASMNILNYFVTLDTTSGSFNGPNTSGPNNDIEPRGANTVEELDRQADKIIEAIIQMDADVLGLVELENDDDDAISDLVTRLNTELGSEIYDFVRTGDVGTDAITNGIIYKVASAIPVGDVAILTEFNGESFVDPLDTGTDRNRPSVAQTFQDVSTGELITVAVNHFKSKGSGTGAAEDEDMSDGAGSSNATRAEGAAILAEWLASDPTDTGAVKQLIVGDLNAYAMEDPLDVLAAAGFTDLAAAALGEDAYSFVFDGQIGTLDYILANEAVVDDVTGVTEWHINSDEADAIDYNIQVLEFGDGTIVTRDPAIYDGETAARHSDHDPLLIGLSLTPVEPEFNLVMGTDGRDNLIGTDGDDIIHSLAGSYDRMTGGDGADVFVFGDETTNGIRERDVIMDYEVGIDSIVLEAGTNVASIRETSSQVVVFLDGDRDAIYVRGDGVTADNITIFTDDLFQFV